MRRLIPLLIALGIAADFTAARAGTVDPRLVKNDVCGRYEIFHINGVDTNLAGAQANLERLQAEFGNAHEEHLISYGLLFNSTAGLAFDLLDSARQVIADYPGLTLREFFRWIRTQIFPDEESARIGLEINARIAARLGLTAPEAYNDADLANMVNTLRSTHQPTGKLLLVPHSQGNLYANLVWERVVTGVSSPPPLFRIETNSIGMMGVGTPTYLRVGEHVTSRQDLVMRAVRLIAPVSTPQANISLFRSAADLSGHNFRETYLTQGASRTTVVLNMEEALSRLTSSAVPLRWLREYAEYYNCSGILYFPYPPPWRCPFQSQFVNPPEFPTPIVTFGVAGQPQRVVRSGSLGEIAELARAHATGCVNLLVEDYRRVQLTGDRSYHLIPGCGAGYPWQTPYGRGDTAWEIYSGDYSEFRMGGDTSTYPDTSVPYVTTVNADMYPACRR